MRSRGSLEGYARCTADVLGVDRLRYSSPARTDCDSAGHGQHAAVLDRKAVRRELGPGARRSGGEFAVRVVGGVDCGVRLLGVHVRIPGQIPGEVHHYRCVAHSLLSTAPRVVWYSGNTYR